MSLIDRVIAYALAQVGKPYRFFTRGPDSFDCSGLTLAAYAQIGIRLVHYSGAQACQARRWTSGTSRSGPVISCSWRPTAVPGSTTSASPSTTGCGYRPGDRVRGVQVNPLPPRQDPRRAALRSRRLTRHAPHLDSEEILGQILDRVRPTLGPVGSTVERMNRRTIRVPPIGALCTTGAIVAGAQGFGGVPVSASASSSSSSPSSSPGTTPGGGSTASSSPASVPATVSSVAVAGSPTQVSYVAGDAATVILDPPAALCASSHSPSPRWPSASLKQPSAHSSRCNWSRPLGRCTSALSSPTTPSLQA